MPSICFYFQVHQPYRLRHVSLFDVGGHDDYFDEAMNSKIARKVADKCYLPMNELLTHLCTQYEGRFKVAFSISGVALEQFATYTPDVLESFQKLVATGHVELLAETYYHSLSSLFSGNEFKAQVKKQVETIQHYFGVTPTAFRNTELIYSDGIADMVADMGFTAMLTEGADHVMQGWRSPNHVYNAHTSHGREMALLLKNYRLSDDIAFRFSQQSWPGWPLTADKFAKWVHEHDASAETINLFMDYETFGEHQWADTGIFTFMRHLPEAIWKHPSFDFATPSEVAARYPKRGTLSIPQAISWADTERDLSAWLGNPMQDGSVAWVYELQDAILATNDNDLIHQWRKLQTSDHFYYMCTKYWADGDVHRYFSAYDRPHDPYIIMTKVLTDLEILLRDRLREGAKKSITASEAGVSATDDLVATETMAHVASIIQEATESAKRSRSISRIPVHGQEQEPKAKPSSSPRAQKGTSKRRTVTRLPKH